MGVFGCPPGPRCRRRSEAEPAGLRPARREPEGLRQALRGAALGWAGRAGGRPGGRPRWTSRGGEGGIFGTGVRKKEVEDCHLIRAVAEGV